MLTLTFAPASIKCASLSIRNLYKHNRNFCRRNKVYRKLFSLPLHILLKIWFSEVLFFKEILINILHYYY